MKKCDNVCLLPGGGGRHNLIKGLPAARVLQMDGCLGTAEYYYDDDDDGDEC